MGPFHPGKTTSEIWKFFSKIPDKHGLAVCDSCHKKLSYKTTITNLRKHMEVKHPDMGANPSKSHTSQPEKPVKPPIELVELPETLSTKLEIENDEMEEMKPSEFVDLNPKPGRLILSETSGKIIFDSATANPGTSRGGTSELDDSNDLLVPRKKFNVSMPMNRPAKPQNPGQETEFDVFGRGVAAQLNSMDHRMALELQLKVQQMITQFRLKYDREFA